MHHFLKLVLLALLLAFVVLPAGAQPSGPVEDFAPKDLTAVRLLVLPDARLTGRAKIQALALAPDLRELVFFIDGEEAGRSRKPPWTAKLRFADPPREQILEVRALGPGGRELGRDEMVVNFVRRPFRLRLAGIEIDRPAGRAEIVSEIQVPRDAELESLHLEVGGERRASLEMLPPDGEPWRAEVALDGASDDAIVQVVATLRDGRTLEDATVLGSRTFGEEIDVNRIELQVLVTHRHGPPVTDLKREDFEIFQDGKAKPIEAFRVAEEVPLTLGLVLDSSGSMRSVWDLTLDAANRFLDTVLRPVDRAFLVDFDERLRVVVPPTAELQDLRTGLESLELEGGTALYDSLLYAALQLEGEPGRRALVAVTDGRDTQSLSAGEDVAEHANRLGVPIYVVALDSLLEAVLGAPDPGLTLKFLTDPTGGRLIRTRNRAGLGRAFAQIDAELRHRYLLTFATERPPQPGERIEVRVQGRPELEVRAVFARDQVQ